MTPGKTRWLRWLAPVALLLIAGMTAGRLVRQETVYDDVHESEEHAFQVERFAEGLETPWGMAFLPDGRMLVTEKEGRLRYVDTDGSLSDPIDGVPAVRDAGQGGLLDVQLHPNFAANGLIYLTFTDPKADGDDAGFTALLRARLDGMRLAEPTVLFRAPQDLYTSRGVHFGSRIVFDDDGFVYFSIGDRGQRDRAQDLTVPNGKIHRLHDDGRIPADNPFVDEPDAVASIWSYGHRNPQGLAIHPVTGDLWETEHGPRGGDELNHIRKGLNYGWPVITYGINYNGTIITELTEKEGMEQPILHWTPSIAVCGIDFYTGDRFPNWKNNLFVSSLKFQEVRRLVIDGMRVTHQEVLFNAGGRVRDIQTGPDGYLYLALENPGRIVRLVPAGS